MQKRERIQGKHTEYTESLERREFLKTSAKFGVTASLASFSGLTLSACSEDSKKADSVNSTNIQNVENTRESQVQIHQGDKMQNTQEVVKVGSLGEFKGDSKIFSGDVNVKMLFKSGDYRNYGGAEVTFSPRARSAWHTHPAGQTLIVTQGTIYTGTKEGITQIAKPGDVVLCPSNVEHWHGAGLTEKGVHIALTHEKDGRNVTWLELLNDEEYEGYIKEAESKAK